MNAAPRPVTPSRRVVSTLIVAAVWAVLALPLVVPFQCPSARINHMPCPGCGMTRACMFFLHGDFGASFAMHPLAVPTALAQGAFAVATLYLAWQKGAPWAAFEARAGQITLYVLMGVMTLVFILWFARAGGAFGGPVPV